MVLLIVPRQVAGEVAVVHGRAEIPRDHETVQALLSHQVPRASPAKVVFLPREIVEIDSVFRGNAFLHQFSFRKKVYSGGPDRNRREN